MNTNIKELTQIKQVNEIATNVLVKALDGVTELNYDNLKTLSDMCGVSFYVNNNELVERIDKMAYALYQSDVWEDLVHCNYVNIVDYLYIARSATRYAEVNNCSGTLGSKSLSEVIQGPYLLKAEWSLTNSIAFNLLAKQLKISLKRSADLSRIVSTFNQYQSDMWKWTNINHEVLKEYALYVSTFYTADKPLLNHIEQLITQEIISGIKSMDLLKTIEFLFISTVLEMDMIHFYEVALKLFNEKNINTSNALPLIIVIDFYEKSNGVTKEE